MQRRRSRTPTAHPYDIDERLVVPETRFEVIDGEVVYVSPADPPHAVLHAKLAAILAAYAAAGFVVACDMLTRTSAKGDMAPDASVYPAGPDPTSGGRQLEHLAFEIVSTQTLAAAARKARALVERGVRRVFALDVSRRRCLEWSGNTGAWEILGPSETLTDAALALGLPVRELVSAARADDAVARALLAKKNPVVAAALRAARGSGHEEGQAEGRTEGKAEGKAEGKVEGKAEAVLLVLASRGLPVSKGIARTIRGTRDERTLDAWLARAGICRSAEELGAASVKPAASTARPPAVRPKPRRRS